MILGTGAKIIPVHGDVKDYLRSKGIALEVQDTVSAFIKLFTNRRIMQQQHNACAAFHYLMDEGRLAGAALIPPEYM